MEDMMTGEREILFPGSEEYKTFVEDVATDVINTLNDNEKSYMKEHTDPIEYHFTLGMDIRNNYIHSNEKYCFMMPDDVSDDIIKCIIGKLLERI